MGNGNCIQHQQLIEEFILFPLVSKEDKDGRSKIRKRNLADQALGYGGL